MSDRETAKAAMLEVTGISESRAEEALANIEAAGLTFGGAGPDARELQVAYDSISNINDPRVERAAEALRPLVEGE